MGSAASACTGLHLYADELIDSSISCIWRVLCYTLEWCSHAVLVRLASAPQLSQIREPLSDCDRSLLMVRLVHPLACPAMASSVLMATAMFGWALACTGNSCEASESSLLQASATHNLRRGQLRAEAGRCPVTNPRNL